MSKYRAFISYSHRDEAWATWLHRKLERYRLPKRLGGGRLYPVFRDREELPTAIDLGRVIEDALEQSETLIVVCSPNAAASKWVNAEIETFKLLGRANRILALIVEGEPPACFPPAIDGEPIAADVRPGKDGRGNALLKLVAGTAGVGFDELRQRDAQRRQRRMLALTSASLALAVVMAALGGFALYERNEARREHERAQRRFDEVRSLANIFIHDIHDAIQHLEGSTEARRLLVKTALDYLDRLSAEGGDDRELWMEIATAYLKVGDVQGRPNEPNLGDLDGALTSYRKALSIHERYEDAVTERASANVRIGSVLRVRREYDDSARHLETAVAALQGRADGARLLAMAHGLLAHTFVARADDEPTAAEAWLAEAKRHAETSLAIDEAGGDRRDRMVSLDRIASIELRLGEADAALAHLRFALAEGETLLREIPDSGILRRDVVVLHGRIADLHAQRGRSDEERRQWEMLLSMLRELAAADPANLQIQRDLAVAHGKLGAYDRAAEIYESILAREPSNDEVRRNLIWTLMQQGASPRRVRELYRMGADRPAASVRDKLDYAQMLLFTEPSDPRAALPHALDAVAMTREADPEALDMLANTYHRLGDSGNAVLAMRKAIALVTDDPAYRAALEAALAEFEDF